MRLSALVYLLSVDNIYHLFKYTLFQIVNEKSYIYKLTQFEKYLTMTNKKVEGHNRVGDNVDR